MRLIDGFKICPSLLITIFSVLLFLTTKSAISQDAELNMVLSVDYVNIPLHKIIEDLEKQTGLNFSYSSKTIPTNKKISYTANSKKVIEIIEEILLKSKVHYEIIGGYLVLSEVKPELSPEKKPKPQKYTISGTITDASSNEVLIGAAIYNKETGTGTLSNKYGFFSLTLPKGNYSIEISYLGYTIDGKEFNLQGNQQWNVTLQPMISMVEEIKISSFNKEEIILASLAAQNNVTAIEATQKTAALGETDMLHALGNLPGINFQNEGSSYFYVRGGNRDQNLILLDEATIFNPSHFLGLFTPIIPEAVKHTEVYKADFPIQYGGRLSSVIDIRTRDGNMQKFSGSGSLGLVATRLSFEGPFKKNSSSYFVSFRRSHLGMFIKTIQPGIEELYFSDFTSKFNVKIGDKDRLFLTLYNGKDKFLNNTNEKKEGLEWGNSSMTLRWNHIYGTRLFSNTTFYTSKYDYYLHTNYIKGIYWNSHISSSNLKSEFTYFVNPKNKLKFGLQLGGYFFNPGRVNDPQLTDEYQVSQVNSTEVTLYVGGEHTLSKWLNMNYGVRLSDWANLGEAFSVQFNQNYQPTGYTNYKKGERYYNSSNIEPRLSLSFKTGQLSALKVSYNRTLQHINLINNSISPFNSLEVWLPSGPNIKPQHANIYNIGYLYSIQKSNIDIQVDFYYKQLYNQVGYNYHAKMLLNPFLEGEIRQGTGKAYGFEIFAKKSVGRLSGQIGYSYLRSKLKINGLNGNKEFYSRQDKPIDFSLTINYHFKPRWTGNLAIHYGSGIKYTTPTGFYDYQGAQVPIYTKQNNDRLPSYKRVDIGTNIRLNKIEKRFEHFLTINLYNFFAYSNPFSLNFNKTVNEHGDYVVLADKLTTKNQISTSRFVYSIVPSITYNMRF